MVLNHAILRLPKKRLHLTHFIPCWCSVVARHADMLPTSAFACNDSKHLIMTQLHDEAAILRIPRRVAGNLDTVTLRNP
jgi:hypothetical protein